MSEREWLNAEFWDTIECILKTNDESDSFSLSPYDAGVLRNALLRRAEPTHSGEPGERPLADRCQLWLDAHQHAFGGFLTVGSMREIIATLRTASPTVAEPGEVEALVRDAYEAGRFNGRHSAEGVSRVNEWVGSHINAISTVRLTGDVEALDKIERLAEMISEHGTDDIAASAARDISYAVAALRSRTVGEGNDGA